MQFLVNVSKLGPTIETSGIVISGGDYHKSAHFDIKTQDYISQSSLPATPRGTDTSEEDGSKALQDVLISPARLSDLGSLIKISLIQKLAPSISKEGYEESATTSSSDRQQAGEPAGSQRAPPRTRDDPAPANPPQPHHPLHDPLAEPPRHRPIPVGDFPPPGFEDEYEMNRPPRGFPGAGPRHPLNIGEQDLNPPGLGPRDPLRPHLGGGMGGGMHPTFDDPLFGGGGGGFGGGMGPGGLQNPPGARWDPTGPQGGPRGGGLGGRFPGGPPNPFGGFGDGDFI
jgi:hypothetical protein